MSPKEILSEACLKFLKINPPKYETKFAGDNARVTVVTRIFVPGRPDIESFGRLKVTLSSAELSQQDKRYIVICAENRAARNLLSCEEVEDEKNSFQTNLVQTVWPSSDARYNKSHKSTQKRKNKERMMKSIERWESSYIFVDVERASGGSDSEMIQLAMTSGHGRTEFNSYIKPVGGLDPVAASVSHKMKIIRGELSLRGQKLPVLPLNEVCVKFIDHLRQIKDFTRTDLTLVFHGDQDIFTIANSFDSVGLLSGDDGLLSVVSTYIDFQQSISKC